MAELIINTEKIKSNIAFISEYLNSRNINWSLITKLFSGEVDFIKNVFDEETRSQIQAVGDSRLESLKRLSELWPSTKKYYIKPPAKYYTDEIVKYADVSLNSSKETLDALNVSAKKQNKIHEVILMIELGDLREGTCINNCIDLYNFASELTNLKVLGLGTNLGCLCGVEPTKQRLMPLVEKFKNINLNNGDNLKLLSGGTSITLPLIEDNTLPIEINHFRIGEAAFLGIIPEHNIPFKNLYTDAFEFYANIIEIEEKLVNADCSSSLNENKESGSYKSIRAILDFGKLDAVYTNLEPVDNLKFVGATSDMTVVEIGRVEVRNKNKIFRVGDRIKFKPNYMSVSNLMHSKFVHKEYH
ncbi:MAG: alanine racemase [bacterium]